MSATPRDPAILQATLDAVEKHGTVTAAARALGVNRGTFQHRYEAAKMQAPDGGPRVKALPTVDDDRQKQRAALEASHLKKKYDEALKTLERQERELRAFGAFDHDVDAFAIKPKLGAGRSEGTVVIVGSDWHAEERVEAHTISGLNSYDLDIAKARATQFFQAGLRLTDLLAKDIHIKHVVTGLLGDFISGDIHDEVAEVAQLEPMHAIAFARTLIISGIEFWLNHSKYDFTFQCHSGNHGRTTKTTRFATENGHSLEFLMYAHLADYFRSEPRVKFLISKGYHSYLDIYDQTIRFHHGHAVKYGGGVGGIYIPVNKAISQWNKGRRADLDVFGHFHQMRDGGNFICNGSLIGFNSYALSIKADYEPPKQALFLIDRDRGRTCTWPILFGTQKAKGSRAA